VDVRIQAFEFSLDRGVADRGMADQGVWIARWIKGEAFGIFRGDTKPLGRLSARSSAGHGPIGLGSDPSLHPHRGHESPRNPLWTTEVAARSRGGTGVNLPALRSYPFRKCSPHVDGFVTHLSGEPSALESKGVVFTGPTRVIPGKVKLAGFKDPDGYALRLAAPDTSPY
jgi:hypothetical protein